MDLVVHGIKTSGGGNNQSILETLKKHFQKLTQTTRRYSELRIGIFEDATNEDGEKVAFYAACNEFGTRRIPSRPFMRITAEKNSGKWVSIFRTAVQNKELSRTPAILKLAFSRVGIVARNDMQATIMSDVPPPNTEATIRRKMKRATAQNPENSQESATGYYGTLLDTGAMYKSIGSRIVDSNGAYVDD